MDLNRIRPVLNATFMIAAYYKSIMDGVFE